VLLPDDTVHSSSISSSDANSHENNIEAGQDDDEDEDSMSDHFLHIIQEGEGSALRANTLVGDKYQVTVGPFIPNQVAVSQNPQHMWKPSCASDAALQTFGNELAGFHTPFLCSHNLASDEPYKTLRSDHDEENAGQEAPDWIKSEMASVFQARSIPIFLMEFSHAHIRCQRFMIRQRQCVLLIHTI